MNTKGDVNVRHAKAIVAKMTDAHRREELVRLCVLTLRMIDTISDVQTKLDTLLRAARLGEVGDEPR